MKNLFPEVINRNGLMGLESSLWDMWNGDFFKSMNEAAFATDIEETEEAYFVHADLPGLTKENIQVDYKDNILSIQATRQQEKEEKKENEAYIRKERCSGTYIRQFVLDGINEDHIKASYQDGVLEITLPKNNKEEHGRRVIDIQ